MNFKKKLERYLRVNLLGPGPPLMKKEFTGLQSHRGLKKWYIAFSQWLEKERFKLYPQVFVVNVFQSCIETIIYKTVMCFSSIL
jgi:hypothetical protein